MPLISQVSQRVQKIVQADNRSPATKIVFKSKTRIWPQIQLQIFDTLQVVPVSLGSRAVLVFSSWYASCLFVASVVHGPWSVYFLVNRLFYAWGPSAVKSLGSVRRPRAVPGFHASCYFRVMLASCAGKFSCVDPPRRRVWQLPFRKVCGESVIRDVGN